MKGNHEPPAAGEGFHHPSTSLSACLEILEPSLPRNRAGHSQKRKRGTDKWTKWRKRFSYIHYIGAY